MATAGVILSIGSKFGPGGLASLQAGIQMIGQLAGAIKGAFDEAWKYDVMVKQLEVDTSLADQATKGLIDTTELVRGAMKFQAAQMKITDKQLRDIAVAAENMADKLGTDATEEFNKLTDAITKGQTRALKQYGLDLENTEDLLLAQAEALQKVTDLGAQMSTEYDNLGDRLYALDNSVGTLTNTVLASAESWKGLNEFLDEVINGTNTLTESIGEVGILGTLSNALDVVNSGFASWSITLVQNLGLVSDEIAMIAQLRNQMVLTAKAEQTFTAGKSWDQIVGGLGAGEQTPDVIGLAADSVSVPGAKKKRKGGGGGGRRQAESMVFAEEDVAPWWADPMRMEVAAEQQQVINDLLGEQVELSSDIFGAEEAAFISETEQWELERQHELQRQADEERKIAYLDQYTWAHQHATEAWIFGEQNYIAESNAMWNESLITKLQMSKSVLSGWGALMDAENKKAFEAGKVLNIAMVGIDTLAGAIAAYRAMAGIPYVGPALGIAAAAGVTAAGAVAIAKISKMKYKGGAPSSGAVPSNAASGGTSHAGSAPSQSGQDNTITINNVVQLDGERLYQSVSKYNRAALRGGRTGAFAEAS